METRTKADEWKDWSTLDKYAAVSDRYPPSTPPPVRVYLATPAGEG